jgi:hypothetical protein
VSHLWCPRCDLIDPGDGPDHSCGVRLVQVPHDADMTDLLMLAQALAGLVTTPPGFDRSQYTLEDLQADMDRRDEIMATVQAEAEATA